MKTAVIGASGYAGGELLRLLALHPHFEVAAATAFSSAGKEITSVHPQLQSYGSKKFTSIDDLDFNSCELFFIALPHGESAALIPKIAESAKIVDLGADFRLENSNSWSKYYSGSHAGTWVYGLPELPKQRELIKGANRIANPGCYATSVALGLAPALPFIEVSDVVVVAASGTTGAGRSAKINLLASEVMGSLTSYKFGGVHQHTPEIEESLSKVAGKSVKISFTPILAPMPRGILSTITAKLTAKIATQEIHKVFSDAYQDELFVRVLPLGQMPATSSLTGSNNVCLQVAVDEHTNRLIISVALDNLGKGAAGQGIQNANLICGFAETSGLNFDGIGS